jgi:hypothetical protein
MTVPVRAAADVLGSAITENVVFDRPVVSQATSVE